MLPLELSPFVPGIDRKVCCLGIPLRGGMDDSCGEPTEPGEVRCEKVCTRESMGTFVGVSTFEILCTPSRGRVKVLGVLGGEPGPLLSGNANPIPKTFLE